MNYCKQLRGGMSGLRGCIICVGINMRDLARANDLISRIAQQYTTITPITSEDFELFQSFFTKESHSYGNSWTYITQGMYGIGPNKLGYKYYDGKHLSAVCAYPRVEKQDEIGLFWIRPMGDGVEQCLYDISKEVRPMWSGPIFVKKIFHEQYDRLLSLGFSDISVCPWHHVYTAEDDTHPEVIIDIRHTMGEVAKLGKTRQLNRSYQYYNAFKKDSELVSSSIFTHPDDALGILGEFFEERKSINMKNISKPTDYYAMLFHPNKQSTIFEKLLYYGGKPVGFYVGEVQSATHASQYAMVSVRKALNHLSDFMMFDMAMDLEKNNITYLNLGGSETDSLFEFKQKFIPATMNAMCWVVMP